MELTLRPKTLVEKSHSSARGVNPEACEYVDERRTDARAASAGKKIPVSWSESPVNLDYKKWNIVPVNQEYAWLL